ncbi:MAG TPA: HEAT repeat domain-containing protein [Symbiobacteriaceae bacterium]|nr:HEAT repeat domain-containing protein [Symbiobacteriaceae bacterium]
MQIPLDTFGNGIVVNGGRPGGPDRPATPPCFRICAFMVNGANASISRFRRDLARARTIFGQAGVLVEEGQFREINDATLLDHPDWFCDEPGMPADTVRLFNMRGACRPIDLLAYYVRSIGGGFAGCGSPRLINGFPGFVVVDYASATTFSHEVGHAVAGLGHSTDTTNLMFTPTSGITANPPQLTDDQIRIINFSRLVRGCEPVLQGGLTFTSQLMEGPTAPAQLALPGALGQVRAALVASEESLDPVLRLGQGAIPALAMLLVSDQDPIIRTRAAAALGRLNGMTAIMALERAARQDASPIVRVTAVNALGRLGGPVAQTVLMGATQDPDIGVRITAMRSLARFPTPAANMTLAQAVRQGIR